MKRTRMKGMKTRTWSTVLFASVVFVTQSGYDACSGDILHDSGFDMWCGDSLCSWQVEKGDIHKVPTWNQADPGVEMVGDDVILSQTSDIDQGLAPCVQFDLVADIDPDAAVTLDMDLYGDGSVDYHQQIPTSDWAALTYVVKMPARYQGIVFRLRKQGGGHAVLAQIRARSLDECDGAAIAQPAQPLGSICLGQDDTGQVGGQDAWCASGVCTPSEPGNYFAWECSTCADDGDCDQGQVCGVSSAGIIAALAPYSACVAAGSRVLGARCRGDGECATGICAEGVCSACRPGGTECDGGGGSCARRTLGPSGQVDDAWGPYQCAPGTAPSGAACLADGDCQSGACGGGTGSLDTCLDDGRACRNDGDCPPDVQSTLDGHEFGRCLSLGTAGGTCQ